MHYYIQLHRYLWCSNVGQTSFFFAGHIPIVPLNYTAISNEGSFNRDMVELCIKEILLAMSRCLFLKRSVQLDFYMVGRVIVKSSSVRIKFFHDFIKQLDFSEELENAFRLRTSQSDMSVMTNPLPSQLCSSSDHLPRYSVSISWTCACLCSSVFLRITQPLSI